MKNIISKWLKSRKLKKKEDYELDVKTTNELMKDIINAATIVRQREKLRKELSSPLDIVIAVDKLYLEKCKEVNQLKEKQRQKRPIEQSIRHDDVKIGICQECREWWLNEFINFCPKCGQAIDWSVEEWKRQ